MTTHRSTSGLFVRSKGVRITRGTALIVALVIVALLILIFPQLFHVATLVAIGSGWVIGLADVAQAGKD